MNDTGAKMMPRKRILKSAMLALTLLTASTPAFAYLDPSTASMVISAIVGLLATISLAIKTYWYKLKSFFSKDKSADSASREPSPNDTEASPDP